MNPRLERVCRAVSLNKLVWKIMSMIKCGNHESVQCTCHSLHACATRVMGPMACARMGLCSWGIWHHRHMYMCACGSSTALDQAEGEAKAAGFVYSGLVGVPARLRDCPAPTSLCWAASIYIMPLALYRTEIKRAYAGACARAWPHAYAHLIGAPELRF